MSNPFFSIESSRRSFSLDKTFLKYEENISAKLEKKEKQTRLPCKNEVEDRSEDLESASVERTTRPGGE